MLWLPVALGLGIAIYFELPSEPALWLGPALAAAALVLVFFAPAGSLGRAVAIGRVAAAVGFGLIAWRTASVAAPTLSRPLFKSTSKAASPTSSACPRACASRSSWPKAAVCRPSRPAPLYVSTTLVLATYRYRRDSRRRLPASRRTSSFTPEKQEIDGHRNSLEPT